MCSCPLCDPKPMRSDPPPRDARQDRCCVCGSAALLLPGYCPDCGEAVCRLCEGKHARAHDRRAK